MRILKVPGMMCQMCVKRISTAMEDAGIQFEIDLAAKTVSVSVENANKAIEILDDLGFDAE